MEFAAIFSDVKKMITETRLSADFEAPSIS